MTLLEKLFPKPIIQAHDDINITISDDVLRAVALYCACQVKQTELNRTHTKVIADATDFERYLKTGETHD